MQAVERHREDTTHNALKLRRLGIDVSNDIDVSRLLAEPVRHFVAQTARRSSVSDVNPHPSDERPERPMNWETNDG